MSLVGYNYRKQMTIDGSTAGAQTDYQKPVKVFKSTIEEATPFLDDADEAGLRRKGQQKLLRSKDGKKLFMVYQKDDDHVQFLYSEDEGETWLIGADLGLFNAIGFVGEIVNDSSGYIHLLCTDLNGDTEHQRSDNPNDVSAFSIIDTQILDSPTDVNWGLGVDIDSNDYLYLFIESDSGRNYQAYYSKYTVGWSVPVLFTETTGGHLVVTWPRVYVDGSNTIHVIFSVYNNTTKVMVAVGYMKSTDGGTTWTKSDGTVYSLPIDLDTEIENITSRTLPRANTILGDGSDNPIILLGQDVGADSHDQEAVYFYKWNGSSWDETIIDDSAARIYRIGGLMRSGDTIIAAVGVRLAADTYRDSGYYISTDGGSTWSSINWLTTDANTISKHYDRTAIKRDGANYFAWLFQRGTDATGNEILFAIRATDDYAQYVSLNSHCQDDFDDVRFTKSDGLAELAHWRDSYTLGVKAKFWVEFDSIPVSPNSANFYTYYGNAGASSGSNGDNTFDFFDDFETDLSKWTIILNGTSSITLVASPVKEGSQACRIHSAGDGTPYMRKLGLASRDYLAQCWARLAQTNASFAPHIHWWDINDRRAYIHFGEDGDLKYWDTMYHIIKSYLADTWYKLKVRIRKSSDKFDLWVDDIPRVTNGDLRDIATTDTGIYCFAQGAVAGDHYLDLTFVAKSADPEPSWGSWGSEEGMIAAGMTGLKALVKANFI